MTFIMATNFVASRPPELWPTGTLTARANFVQFAVNEIVFRKHYHYFYFILLLLPIRGDGGYDNVDEKLDESEVNMLDREASKVSIGPSTSNWYLLSI